MSRYIDADKAIEIWKDQDYIKLSSQEDKARIILDTVPTADVVEVVRCKDCKFWDSDCIWCNLWGNTQEYGNGYCSYGERKEQEHE